MRLSSRIVRRNQYYKNEIFELSWHEYNLQGIQYASLHESPAGASVMTVKCDTNAFKQMHVRASF